MYSPAMARVKSYGGNMLVTTLIFLADGASVGVSDELDGAVLADSAGDVFAAGC
jgi:hypothetical protein